MPLRKSLRRKDISPVQVFNADKSVLVWKKMLQSTFISKEEKRAPGFKEGRNRLILLFCTNTDRRSSAREQGDVRQPGRRVLIIQDCFWLLLRRGPSMMWALKLKQVVEEGLVPYRNMFRETKKQRCQTEITMYFHEVHRVCLPLLPSPPPPPLPLLPLFHLLHPRQQTNPSSSSFSWACSMRRQGRWRPLRWSTST